MPKPLIITLKDGVDPVYGFQKAPAPQGMSHQGQYVLMDVTNTYALGVQALREACKKEPLSPHPKLLREDGGVMYRPLTFRENLYARVTDFNQEHDGVGNKRTLDDRLRFFNRRLDPCTGIAYKAGENRMKIVPVCENLIEIASLFNESFLPINYDSLGGEELDRSVGKYNVLLTRNEVIDHPAWLAAVEHDKTLLKEYADIVFAQLQEKYQRNTGMRFWIRDTTATDELHALLVHYLDCYSDAGGYNSLSYNGSFLLVAPSGAPQAQRAQK